jgi:hypothetical protein
MTYATSQNLEKQVEAKPKTSRGKEILILSSEINEIETKKKKNYIKSQEKKADSLKKISKIDNPWQI